MNQIKNKNWIDIPGLQSILWILCLPKYSIITFNAFSLNIL